MELSLPELSPCILLIAIVVKYLWMTDVMIFEICFKLIRDGARECSEVWMGQDGLGVGGAGGWVPGTSLDTLSFVTEVQNSS